MYDSNKENEATKREIEIRGRYLMMACDIEYSMLNIIMFCNPDPYNHEREGQFREMRMGGKIHNVIADMKKHKQEYYEEFKEDFEGLEEFRLVRNDMSHCIGRFPNAPDFSLFRIMLIMNDEEAKERIAYRDYTQEYINESLSRFAKLNGRLAELWLRLKRELDDKIHPLVHP